MVIKMSTQTTSNTNPMKWVAVTQKQQKITSALFSKSHSPVWHSASVSRKAKLCRKNYRKESACPGHYVKSLAYCWGKVQAVTDRTCLLVLLPFVSEMSRSVSKLDDALLAPAHLLKSKSLLGTHCCWALPGKGGVNSQAPYLGTE